MNKRICQAISLALFLSIAVVGCGGGGSGASTQAKTDPETGNLAAAEPDPVVPEPDPVVSEPDPVVSEPDPVVSEPDPVVSEPDPVVSEPEPDPVVPEPDPVVPEPDPPLSFATELPGFETVSEELWDETAIRRVLHTFAYGGHATDEQITAWANMPARAAITQMLTFDQHNLLISPVTAENYDGLDTRDGTLKGLGLFWSSDDPDNGIYPNRREAYRLLKYNNRIWTRAATSRGLNPFRQKIGLWETNYHLAVNRLAGPTPEQIIRYYDDIMSGHEAGLPYHEVLATAALSAAVATQYGHRRNVFIFGECRCNEDFAREFHQLFFGNLGEYDSQYHENVAIKNTAKALTGMPVALSDTGALLDYIEFDPELHYQDSLNILNVEIAGNSAEEKLAQLSQYAINHEESLRNLPIKIIEGLADDNLTVEKIANIQLAWRSMPEKNLLDFLRAYAISDLFHDETRVKFHSSIDRHLLIANQITLNNQESYLDLYEPDRFEDEGVVIFEPTHNVFGSQTGEEASNSVDIFRNNYNSVTGGQAGNWYRRTTLTRYETEWTKNWATVLPQTDGKYVVQEIAEWLWKRFIGDGLKNFGGLERMHVYALLATGQDIGYLRNPANENTVLFSEDLLTDPELAQLVTDLATYEVDIHGTNIGQAINFIVATPYIFAQEGG